MTPRDRDALLAAYRAERGPSRAQADRLWARLSEDAPQPASVRRLRPAASTRGRAVAIGAVVLAAAAVAVLALRPSSRRLQGEAPQAPSMAAHGADADRETTGDVSAVEPARAHLEPSPSAPDVVEMEGEAATPPSEASPSGRATSKPRAARREPAPAEADPAAPSADSLAEETSLLRRARAALSGGRPAAALDLLEEYDRRFASPRLSEEAEAVRAMARCRQSPTDPVALADAFLSRHPGSLFRKQVQAACAASAPTDAG